MIVETDSTNQVNSKKINITTKGKEFGMQDILKYLTNKQIEKLKEIKNKKLHQFIVSLQTTTTRERKLVVNNYDKLIFLELDKILNGLIIKTPSIPELIMKYNRKVKSIKQYFIEKEKCYETKYNSIKSNPNFNLSKIKEDRLKDFQRKQHMMIKQLTMKVQNIIKEIKKHDEDISNNNIVDIYDKQPNLAYLNTLFFDYDISTCVDLKQIYSPFNSYFYSKLKTIIHNSGMNLTYSIKSSVISVNINDFTQNKSITMENEILSNKGIYDIFEYSKNTLLCLHYDYTITDNNENDNNENNEIDIDMNNGAINNGEVNDNMNTGITGINNNNDISIGARIFEDCRFSLFKLDLINNTPSYYSVLPNFQKCQYSFIEHLNKNYYVLNKNKEFIYSNGIYLFLYKLTTDTTYIIDSIYKEIHRELTIKKLNNQVIYDINKKEKIINSLVEINNRLFIYASQNIFVFHKKPYKCSLSIKEIEIVQEEMKEINKINTTKVNDCLTLATDVGYNYYLDFIISHYPQFTIFLNIFHIRDDYYALIYYDNISIYLRNALIYKYDCKDHVDYGIYIKEDQVIVLYNTKLTLFFRLEEIKFEVFDIKFLLAIKTDVIAYNKKIRSIRDCYA